MKRALELERAVFDLQKALSLLHIIITWEHLKTINTQITFTKNTSSFSIFEPSALSLIKVVLHRGVIVLLCLPKDIWKSLEAFSVGTPLVEEKSATGIQGAEARDATNHPAMHSTAPPT